MNQTVETILKAVLIFAGLFVSADVLALFDAKTIAVLSGAIASVVAIGFDVYSTYRLKKQGIVSTTPAVNVAAPGSPQELAAQEKK